MQLHPDELLEKEEHVVRFVPEPLILFHQDVGEKVRRRGRRGRQLTLSRPETTDQSCPSHSPQA